MRHVHANIYVSTYAHAHDSNKTYARSHPQTKQNIRAVGGAAGGRRGEGDEPGTCVMGEK